MRFTENGNLVTIETDDCSMKIVAVTDRADKIFDAFNVKDGPNKTTSVNVSYVQVHVKVHGRELMLFADKVDVTPSIRRPSVIPPRPAGGWGEM